MTIRRDPTPFLGKIFPPNPIKIGKISPKKGNFSQKFLILPRIPEKNPYPAYPPPPRILAEYTPMVIMLNLIMVMLCQLELKFVHSKNLLKVRLETVRINYLRSSHEFRGNYLDPFKVEGIHKGTLQIFNPCMLSF